MSSIIALIPARAGSKRVKSKNTRLLNGHPLLAYAIATALEANIFDSIAVSSDDAETLAVAERYGATALILRPAELAMDTSPDIGWVSHTLEGITVDAFAILRPTSPFRRGLWVQQAWAMLQSSNADSIRAVRPVAEHPAKMWVPNERPALGMHPLIPFVGDEAPWHSMPTQELPRVVVQTAALEIARSYVLPDSISGNLVIPYFSAGSGQDIDINTEADLSLAEQVAVEHPEWLPAVRARVAA